MGEGGEVPGTPAKHPQQKKNCCSDAVLIPVLLAVLISVPGEHFPLGPRIVECRLISEGLE
jgi:hypothetical protein